LAAPVNAPASTPNSSASSRLSGRAAQLNLISGPDQRRERKWTRAADNSLPVPRSPMMSTGRSRGATRDK